MEMGKEPLLKRSLDIVLSAFMLLISLPMLFPIALAIKLEDGGPVLYRQERWGRNSTRFWLYKFRTMIPGADCQFGIKQAEENDRRITRVGHILRATGLDELPQLMNIFTGEMSFVGPRSLAVGERVKGRNGTWVQYEDIPGFRERLGVRPGLTGLTTIYVPKDADPYRKFRYDLLYIRKRSFRHDLCLIALSFWISFRGKWESRGKKV